METHTHPAGLSGINILDKRVVLCCDDGTWGIPEGRMLLLANVPPYKPGHIYKAPQVRTFWIGVFDLTDDLGMQAEYGIMAASDFADFLAFLKATDGLETIH